MAVSADDTLPRRDERTLEVPDARVPIDDDRHHTGYDHPHCNSSVYYPMLRVVTD